MRYKKRCGISIYRCISNHNGIDYIFSLGCLTLMGWVCKNFTLNYEWKIQSVCVSCVIIIIIIITIIIIIMSKNN